MKIYNNITEVYGNTPLVRINKIMDGAPAHVFAKLEFYNPTSTVKDRLAVAMVDAAEKSGVLKPGGTIGRQHRVILESPLQWSPPPVVIKRY